MKVKVEKLEGSKTKLTITLAAEEFNVEYEKAFDKVLADVEIKGFRKGKAPRKLYLDRFGEGAILQSAIDGALNSSYEEAVTTKKVNVVSKPEIDIDFENLGKDKPFKYTAIVEVYPEVVLGKYYGVEVKKESDEVTEKEIDESINRELKNKSELEVLEDVALENGHTAVFDFCGYVDGVAFEGGKAENYSLEIGSGSFIPGFEEQMLGMKTEEEKKIKVKFPEEYQAENLAGKDAEFEIKLHEIKHRVLPATDEAFFEELKIENVNSLETWREHLRDVIKAEKMEANNNKFTDDVINAVCSEAKVELPEAMINDRLDQMVERVEQQAKAYGLTADQLLSYQGTTLEQYKNLMKESAKKSVLEEVVIGKIIETEKIKLTAKDYDLYYVELAKQYNQDRETVEKNLPKDRVDHYFKTLKTLDLLKEKAVIK
ncbi:MAG: trigger factor [Bacilli bacterium]|nr:trigger factor [Bacilli bacterium]